MRSYRTRLKAKQAGASCLDMLPQKTQHIMSNKYFTACNFKSKAAANRMAAAYRKQMGIGLDGNPRRYGKQKKVKK